LDNTLHPATASALADLQPKTIDGVTNFDDRG
jgi:hypothetical protein